MMAALQWVTEHIAEIGCDPGRCTVIRIHWLKYRQNYRIVDIMAALQWVTENIAEFGGDPGRCTDMRIF
jgi:carboxylesterase type B